LLDRAVAREAAARAALIRAQRTHAAHAQRVGLLRAAPPIVLRAIDADAVECRRRLQLSAAQLSRTRAEHAAASRERDALDRLRARRREEYDAALERAEQAELDDLNRPVARRRQGSP
jgi:hypothetical protein